MASPYREPPRFLLCPRCGELLERVFAGIAACTACNGAWLTQTIALVAHAAWPPGRSEWWRNQLECPECPLDGKTTTMDARAVDGITVDCCPAHGLWFDRGELARLIGAPTGSDALLELQRHVSGARPDAEALARRREEWKAELATRRRQAAELRAHLEAERARSAAAAEAARRREEERTRAAERAEAERVRAELRRARAETDALEHARLDGAHRAQLSDHRFEVLGEVGRLEEQVRRVRNELERLEAELEHARSELREINAKLGS